MIDGGNALDNDFHVSFSDFEYYDIFEDREALQLMATTPTGTYCATVEKVPGSMNRERREAFRSYVLQCMALGQNPHEIEIG